MKQQLALAVALLLLTSGATAFDPSPEWTAPNPPELASMNADQRAAYFAWLRALRAEATVQERDAQIRELSRRIDVIYGRFVCT